MHKLSHLHPALRRLAVLAAIAVVGLSGAQAESTAFQALPEEAPESIFDVKLGSAEAELLVNGSWNASATLQGGLLVGSAGDLTLADEQPLLFSQIPDLYISFLLYRKLFAEIRVSNSASETRYSLGYRGGEGELLREIRLGNDGISFPVLPFLSLGAGSYRSFGLAASLGTDTFSGRAMLRYDQAKRVVKKFVGGSEVTETVIQASAFQRGRWFVAPTSTTVSNLVLYAASTAGTLTGSDGALYRRLEVSEFSSSASTGLVSLAKTAGTKVVAYYPEYDGSGTGNVTLDGHVCLLLYDPDDLSSAGLGRATLALGRYAVSASAGGDAFVRDRATGLRDDSYTVRIDPSGYAEVIQGTASGPQSAAFRQPFASAMGDIYTTDYSGKSAVSYLPALTKEIVVLVYASGSTIGVDSDVIEGSVEVRRNGVPDYAFTIDASAGKLELATAPGLDEEIEVSYLRQSAERSSGSIAAGLGGFFELSDGTSAWTALGLRWSVPGTSYAESGMSDPGSVVFTAGEKDEKGAFTQNLSLAGRWSTEVASGRYRIEGMESSGSQASSFWPEATGLFSVAEEKENLLASSFATLASSLHSSGSAQEALHVTASTGTDLRLVKFIDEVPASSLRTFSFFARGSAGGASISIVLDRGASGTSDDELSITVQPSVISTAWRRYILRYGYGSSEIFYQDSESDSLHALSSSDASGAANLDLSSASRLSIGISGASAGTDLWIDEIVLEDSAGSAALLAKGGLHYEDKDWSLGWGSAKILKGIELAADVSGAWSKDPFASGGSSLATAIGPLGISASIRASVAEGSASARGGHALSFVPSGLPISVKDVFDVDPQTGAFGRSDSASLTLGSWFGIKAEEVTTWAGDAASGTGLFAQSWKAGLDAMKGGLSAQFEASNRANPEGFSGLNGGYFGDWLEGYAYALPAFESESTKRALDFSAQAGLDQARYFMKGSLSSTGLPAISGSPRDDDALLRLQVPLAFGKSVMLTPYYQRAWTGRAADSGSDMVDFAATAFSDLASNLTFWTSMPLSELFGEGAFASFSEYTAASGIRNASYTPELGLALARESGSSWVDLLVPSTLALAWKKQALREDDSLTLAAILSITLKTEAVNVFGGLGAFPIASFFDSDEYSSACQLLLKEVSGEDAVRPTIILQNLATFYANGNRDSLTLDNRFSYAEDASSTRWSEDLKLSLSLVSGKSWLLDLYKLVLGLTDRKAAPKDDVSPGRISIVSSYAESLARTTPVARIIFMAKGTVSSTTTDAEGPELGIDASESVEFKVTVPQMLSLSFKPAASQTRDADSGSTVFGLSITISATVSF